MSNDSQYHRVESGNLTYRANWSPQGILRQIFGYDTFRHQQAEIIDTIICGNDALVLLPTGGGKSICYQIPALIRPGVGIVISPLIALMKDQVDALRQFGVRAAFINSSLDSYTRNAVEQALIDGKLDLLYIAPERLLTQSMLDLLGQVPIALFAIDEAHCVSQWGHDFRKEYQQLSILHRQFPQIPRIALTATADERTRREIIQQLDLETAQIFINSFNRPNIRYQISEATGSPRSRLWEFLQREHSTDAGIVYCLSRKMVEDIADWLKSKGREALPYHAGLSKEMRTHHQERFLREDGLIICATIAFGMGIDKPNVRFVAHLSLPKSIEAYYQETGRAGRDGLPANAWMAYGLQDLITIRNMIANSDAEELFQHIAMQKLDALLGLCELTSCRRQVLLSYFGETTTATCGNCDNCLDPPQTWDATVAAQKALSCVYRTGQRFGVGYLVDVLLGKTTDIRIHNNGHDRVSTFGIGHDVPAQDWNIIFRQLIARRFLETDVEGHGGLHLTSSSRPVLKGELPIYVRKHLPKSAKDTHERRRSSGGLRPQDEPLANALRILRKRLADTQGLPAFFIFHDVTLLDLVRVRPRNQQELLGVMGMGERKAFRYGAELIACIAAHSLDPLLDNDLSDTINLTLTLFMQGRSPEAIAQERNLTLSTIYGHFAEAIKAQLLQLAQVLTIPAEEYQAIAQALRDFKTADTGIFKPVYEALENRYDYGVLRCVAAAEYVTKKSS